MDGREEELQVKASALKCTCNQGPANIVLAVTNRENYGRKEHLSRRYQAQIFFSKLKCVTKVIRYNTKQKWEVVSLQQSPLDFLGLRGNIVGFSDDSTYLVTSRSNFPRDLIHINFYELSPQYAILRNQMIIRECGPFDRIHIHFHPCNRFISAFVYNPEHFYLAYNNGRPESSIFRVFTVFPDISVCLSMTSSATVVCRRNQKTDGRLRKEYLRVHQNGFILNTGVILIMILFSKSLPLKLHRQKVWRVVRQERPCRYHKPPSISVDLGEEIAVESSLIHGNKWEKMTYQLADCKETRFCDQKWPCGLRHPLFVSRHEVCVESLIDSVMTPFIRRTKKFESACYRGSRDYETDVQHVDDRGVFKIIITCICEVQVVMNDGEVTQNIFYLCRIETHWNVFSGWIPGGTCNILKELPHKVAFNSGVWYPSEPCPVEQGIRSNSIHRRGFNNEEQEQRLKTPSGAVELILDLKLF